MRNRSILMLAMVALVAGCNKGRAIDGIRGVQTRFAGIGVFDAGPVWRHMLVAEPKNSAAARLDDDEHIIAVIDGRTGEVRQCGDHSGYCVAMNPWAGAPPVSLPVRLNAHAAEIEAAKSPPGPEPTAPSSAR